MSHSCTAGILVDSVYSIIRSVNFSNEKRNYSDMYSRSRHRSIQRFTTDKPKVREMKSKNLRAYTDFKISIFTSCNFTYTSDKRPVTDFAAVLLEKHKNVPSIFAYGRRYDLWAKVAWLRGELFQCSPYEK